MITHICFGLLLTHQNPKVAGLVNKLSDYRWSSYPEFTGLSKDTLCEKSIILDQFKNIDEFQNFTESSYEIIKNKKDLEALLLD